MARPVCECGGSGKPVRGPAASPHRMVCQSCGRRWTHVVTDRRRSAARKAWRTRRRMHPERWGAPEVLADPQARAEAADVVPVVVAVPEHVVPETAIKERIRTWAIEGAGTIVGYVERKGQQSPEDGNHMEAAAHLCLPADSAGLLHPRLRLQLGGLGCFDQAMTARWGAATGAVGQVAASSAMRVIAAKVGIPPTAHFRYANRVFVQPKWREAIEQADHYLVAQVGQILQAFYARYQAAVDAENYHEGAEHRRFRHLQLSDGETTGEEQ